MSHPLRRPPFDSPHLRGDRFGAGWNTQSHREHPAALSQLPAACWRRPQLGQTSAARMSKSDLGSRNDAGGFIAISAQFRGSQRGRTAGWLRQILVHCLGHAGGEKTCHAKTGYADAKSRWTSHKEPRRFDGRPVETSWPTCAHAQPRSFHAGEWRRNFPINLAKPNRPIAT